MMKARLLKFDKFYWFFLALAFLLSFIWFRQGKIIATAEEGMVFYSPVRTATLYSSFWWDKVAPGGIVSVSVVWAPVMWVAGNLGRILPGVAVQALFYLFFIFAGLSHMYLLTKSIFKSRAVAALAAIFYLFNLYVMAQVFFRSLYDNMFVWLYLPLFIYLLLTWLKSGKKLLLLILSTLIFSYSFSHPAYIILFVLTTLLLSGHQFFSDKKNRRQVVGRVIIFGIGAFIVNIWWIYPMYKLLEDTFFATSIGSSAHYPVLEGVSQSFPLSTIILLREKFYYGNFWDGWYKGMAALVPSILVLLIIIYGWFKSKKVLGWSLLSLLLFVGIFFAKGINPPLGEIFYKILFKLPLVGAIRNPYEKLGLLIVIPCAIFFGYGTVFLYRNFKSLKSRVILTSFVIFLFGFFYWPYWTGKIYPEIAYVTVPAYYEEVNKIMNMDSSDGYALALPLVPEHGAIFNWGYRGVEPSRFLFDKPTIAVGGGASNEKYKVLLKAIHDGENLEELLTELNVHFIVVRLDLDTTVSVTDTVPVTKAALTNTPGVKFVGQYGEVELYTYDSTSHLFEVTGKNSKVSYQKISATKYKAFVSGADSTTKLIFKENYNQKWIARVGGLPLTNHQVIYGYGNAWNLERQGDMEIEVVFKIWPWE